jgi:hypothetical protein
LKKKHDPPPVRDHLPAMFVGDEDPAPAPLASVQANAAAAAPDDLRVVTEGLELGRWMVFGPLMLVGLVTVLDAVGVLPGAGILAIGAAAAYALLIWVTDRYVVKRRKEFLLTGEGIVVEVRHRFSGTPHVTRIPWAEVRAYTASPDAGMPFLTVGGDGDTVTLADHPAREPVRRFIRQFAEQAQRYGIAERPAPQPDFITEAWSDSEMRGVGCFAWLLGIGLLSGVMQRLGVPDGLSIPALVLAGFGMYLWWTLDDSDVAATDRDSRRLIARLRRSLRRWGSG